MWFRKNFHSDVAKALVYWILRVTTVMSLRAIIHCQIVRLNLHPLKAFILKIHTRTAKNTWLMKSHLATLYNVATTLSFPRSVYFNLGPLGWYNCDIIDDVTTLTHETSVDLIYLYAYEYIFIGRFILLILNLHKKVNSFWKFIYDTNDCYFTILILQIAIYLADFPKKSVYIFGHVRSRLTMQMNHHVHQAW